MTFIKPVFWDVEVDLESLALSKVDESYLFRKIIDENINDFKPFGISKETIQTIKEELEKDKLFNLSIIKEILPSFDNKILNLDSEIYSRDQYETIKRILEREGNPPNKTIYLHLNEPRYILFRILDNLIFFIAKNQLEANNVFESLNKKFNTVGKITEDFGLTLKKVFTDKECSETMLKRKEGIDFINEGNPKNEFEEAVITNLSNISNAFLSNVEIGFSKPKETFEYDILFPIYQKFIIDIEIKDYEIIKNEIKANSSETLKSKIILSPLDKARRLGAKVIIVVKGLNKDTFNQLKELADSRDVLLFDEYNFKDGIKDYLLKHLFMFTFFRPDSFTFLRRSIRRDHIL